MANDLNFDPGPPHTTHYGLGPPDPLLGRNGDFYVDKRTNALYGPKENGAWPKGAELLEGGISGSGGSSGGSGGGTTGEQGPPGVGVPPGGDIDWHLVKKTAADFDTEWRPLGEGGEGDAYPFDFDGSFDADIPFDAGSGTNPNLVTDHGQLTGLDDPADHPWAATDIDLAAGVLAAATYTNDKAAETLWSAAVHSNTQDAVTLLNAAIYTNEQVALIGSANPYTAGLRLNAFTHSYTSSLRLDNTTIGSGASSPASLYMNQLAIQMGAEMYVRSFPGTTADWITGGVLGGYARTPWRPGADWGVVVDDTMRNNIKYFGKSGGVEDPTGYAVTAFADALSSRLRFYRAAPPTSATVGVHTVAPGVNWTYVAPGAYRKGFFGASEIYTTTAGAYVDITFTGQEITLWGSRLTSGHVSVGGDLDVYLGATLIGTLSCHDGFPDAVFGLLPWYQASLTLTTADAAFGVGSNTIRVQKRAGNAYPAYLNCWATPTTTPPRVYVVQDGDEYPTSEVSQPSEMAQAYIDYRAAQAFVCADAEYSNYVTVVDLDDWDPVAMTDDRDPFVHPNDAGHACMAAAIRTAINADITDWTPGVHGPSA